MAKCCDYTSGMLREPVTFQLQKKDSIGGGATEISYDERFSTRCYFKFASGWERMHADRYDAGTKASIVIRYRDGLIESDRAIIRGRAYNIKFIDNIELRNKWLKIDLEGGVAT